MLANNLTSFPYYAEKISMIPFGHSRPAKSAKVLGNYDDNTDIKQGLPIILYLVT